MLFVRFPFRINERFHDLKKPVETAPYDVGKGGAVPEAADQKGKQQIQKMAPLCNPIAAQRNVNVIPEPGGKRNMPPAPELFDGKGKIRAFEIRHETDAEQSGASDGNIGIPRKITIDFDCEHHGNDDKSKPYITVYIVEQFIDRDRKRIGDHQFFKIAPCHQLQAVSHIVVREGTLFLILWEQRVRPSDRPGKELREKGNEQRIIPEMLFGRGFAAVNIDQIAHRLEKIKGYARRKQNGHRKRLH